MQLKKGKTIMGKTIETKIVEKKVIAFLQDLLLDYDKCFVLL